MGCILSPQWEEEEEVQEPLNTGVLVVDEIVSLPPFSNRGYSLPKTFFTLCCFSYDLDLGLRSLHTRSRPRRISTLNFGEEKISS